MNTLRIWLAYHILPKNARKYLIKALSYSIKEVDNELYKMIEDLWDISMDDDTDRK